MLWRTATNNTVVPLCILHRNRREGARAVSSMKVYRNPGRQGVRTLFLRCPRLQAPGSAPAGRPGLSSHVWKKAGPGHREASRREQPPGDSCFPAERGFQTALGSWETGHSKALAKS